MNAKIWISLVAGALVALTLTLGSMLIRPYDTPEYADIDTAETAFVVPLEGDDAGQAKFESVKYLEEKKVAVKRVQITHRWSATGRMPSDGKWIATVKLVKFSRSPVTRQWDAGADGARKDQAIWIESQDSVGFSMGFTVTALITDEDAATFLYWYPTGSLADVMDQEVRARVQQVAAEVAARYPLDVLRTKKQEIVDAVRADVIAFYHNRGITITTVGMYGGMSYENPEIQKSIDNAFIAQQEKVVNAAKLEAQQKANDRITLEAQATAEKARREAQGAADARLIAAEAEAKGIKLVNDALAQSQSGTLIELKRLEIQKELAGRWNGQYPTWYMPAAGTAPNLMLQVSPPPAEQGGAERR